MPPTRGATVPTWKSLEVTHGSVPGAPCLRLREPTKMSSMKANCEEDGDDDDDDAAEQAGAGWGGCVYGRGMMCACVCWGVGHTGH